MLDSRHRQWKELNSSTAIDGIWLEAAYKFSVHVDSTHTGFPQVRHYKIPRLFQITLKYFQAFRGAFYNRGGAIILRVNSTNITASEASRKKIWGVVPPHTTFWGYNSCKETYGEPVGQQVANNVTCHNKFPDHISNSLTFLGLPNSLTIPDYPDLWEPCHQSSTKLLRTAHAT